MPVFPKPTVAFDYTVATEVERLRAHKAVRKVPDRSTAGLLIGTWNIANFGAQERRDKDRELIAEIVSWFDLVAIQECRDNFGDLYDVLHNLGGGYRVLMSDASGNDERMGFIYDSARVTLLEEIGEIAFPPSLASKIALPGVQQAFLGFDRTPYLASFLVNPKLSVQLVNVHLFYGSEAKADVERRALETAAVARWCKTRHESQFSFARELIALGDFNMPKPDSAGGNIVYDALTMKGLVTPGHSTQVASAIASDNQYDQIAMFSQTTKDWLVNVGVYDYDAVIFKALWDAHGAAVFKGYLRYYLSDHRPMWVQLAPTT